MVVISSGALVTSPLAYGAPDLSAATNIGVLSLTAPATGIRLLEANATYAEVYRRSVWVAALTNKLANAQARLPLRAYDRAPGGSGATGTRLPTPDEAFGRLLRNPNPSAGRFYLHAWTSSVLDLYGEAMWVKVRDPRTGLPVALAMLHPAQVDIRRDAGTGALRYVHRSRPGGGAEELSWPADDIVHIKLFNPESQLRGMSRLEPLRRALMAEDAIQVAQESFWRRGARPSVLLKHPKTLSDAAAARLASSWEQLQGGAANWGKTAVLEEGAEAQVVQLSASEMQMIDSRKISREEACGLFDVPPPVVHILDRATHSNITEQMRSMYRDTMDPRLGLVESVIDLQLASEFGDRAYARFNLDAVLRGDYETRVASYQRLIYSGVMTPNEARALEDLPPGDENADRLYISAAMLPLEAANRLGAEPNGGPGRPATGTGPSAGSGATGAGSVATRALKDAASGATGDVDAVVAGLRRATERLALAAKGGDGIAGVDLGDLTAGLDVHAAGLVGLHLAHAIHRKDDLGGLRASLAEDLLVASEVLEERAEAARDAGGTGGDDQQAGRALAAATSTR